MTEVTGTGALGPTVPNRPSAATDKPSKSQSDKSQSSTGTAEAKAPAPSLPRGLTIAGETVPTDSAQKAVETVLKRLESHFAQVGDNPPQSGQQLEDLLGQIKLAAPFLDKALAARDAEIQAAGDAGATARSQLNDLLGHAQEVLATARDQLQRVAANLVEGQPSQESTDPAISQALASVLGPDHSIPAFSSEELAQGRQEYVGLVFDSISGALGRHLGAGNATATYTVRDFGATDISA